MGQIITWCKHCRNVVSFEKHDPHDHEHDDDHKHMHTFDHVDYNNHDHDHGYFDECSKCKKRGSF